MSIFPKQLANDHYEYVVDKSLNEFRDDMQNLFSKNAFDISANITGRFTSKDTFKITNRGSFVDMRGYNMLSSCVKGTISQNKQNETVVSFVVKSDSIFKILFFLCPLVALVTIVTNIKDASFWKLFEIGSILVIVVPFFMMIMSSFAKSEIKNKFVSYFGLYPLE
ncbi:MAG: hypothetical protein WCO65_02415 [bacterium]